MKINNLIFSLVLLVVFRVDAQTIKRISINSFGLSNKNIVSTGGQHLAATYLTTKSNTITVGFQHPVRILMDTTLSVKGDLIICKGDTTIISLGKAPFYKWYRNDTLLVGQDSSFIYATVSGKYRAILTDGLGFKDTTRIVEVSVNTSSRPTAPIISRDVNGNLLSNYSSSVSHIWYNANNLSVPINTGATSIKPTTSGYYALKVNQNGCISNISANYYYIVSAVINLNNGEFVKFSPNPFNNILTLSYQLSRNTAYDIEVIHLGTGKVVKLIRNVSNGESIDLNGLINGIYVMHLYSKDRKVDQKIRVVKL